MGLIVIFGAAVLFALMTYAGGGTRLEQLERLASDQGWTIVKRYTNAARGYVVVRVSDLVATISLANERHIGSTVRVEVPSPGAPIFDIRPSAITALVGKKLELQSGLHAYTPEPDETRTMFTPARCQALRTLLADAEVRSDREAIIVVQPPALPLGTITIAVSYAIDLASADRYGTDVLRGLPGAVFRPTTAERSACIELEGPSPIRIEPVRIDDRVVTRATVDQGVVPATLPDLGELGPVTLAADRGGGVTLTWAEIERDPARLLAAIELLRRLAGAPHGGAYR